MDSLNLPSLTIDGAPISMAGRSVKADGIVMGTTSTLEDGLLLWAVCHSVFCMASNRTGNVLLQFIHRTCLSIKEAQTAACRNTGTKLVAFLDLHNLHNSDDSRYARLIRAALGSPVERAALGGVNITPPPC